MNEDGGERRARPNGALPIWRWIDLGRCEPIRAQAFAESVAESVGAGESPNTVLFVQPASPYISLGFHQSFPDELDPDFLRERAIPVVRRVEGGGTTWLDPDQWFYQLVYRDEDGSSGGPADLPRFLAAPALAAQHLGLDVKPRAPSDLVVRDRKISGNAGGDWGGAHLVVGGFLGRLDAGAIARLFRVPHPAVRELFRGEVERWVTSWELEIGRLPDWSALRERTLDAFRTLGLFRARRGEPTALEESRFRSETVPRHEDAGWRELPGPSRPTGTLLRRIRVAGPHELLVFREEGSARLRIAVIDGTHLRAGYVIAPGLTEQPLPITAGSPGWSELEEAVRTEGRGPPGPSPPSR